MSIALMGDSYGWAEKILSQKADEAKKEEGIMKGIKKAMAKSFSNQLGEILIPVDKLDNIFELILGFQPLGIASQGNQIAIAAYYEPAICLAEVSRDQEGLRFKVSWIRGVNHGVQSVRLFPDISQPSGANRAQTVNFGPSGTLWVSRNGDRDFFILSPPVESGGRWSLTGKYELPGEGFVHSMLIKQSGAIVHLSTVESTTDLNEWTSRLYNLETGEMLAGHPLPPYFYGFGSGRNEKLYLVTDYRAKEPNGIYRFFSQKMAVNGIWGNGICFLPDGSALVTKYGQAAPGPFNGDPGSLTYIPAKFFN